jgi:hypothetical protein
MLERVPEEYEASFVQTLTRYRETLVSGIDYDAIYDLKSILSSLSPNTDLVLLDGVAMWLFSGQYGVCQSCGDEIPEKRMLALPFHAVFCRDCQEAKEQDPGPVASKKQRYMDPELNLPKRQKVHIIDPPRQLPKHLII